jgi:hypothetical protein
MSFIKAVDQHLDIFSSDQPETQKRAIPFGIGRTTYKPPQTSTLTTVLVRISDRKPCKLTTAPTEYTHTPEQIDCGKREMVRLATKYGVTKINMGCPSPLSNAYH